MLQNKLNEFFMDRVNESKEEMTEAEIKAYEIALKKESEFYETLKKHLPDTNKGLLLEFEALVNEIANLEQWNAYRRGIKDGFELAQGLKVLGMDYNLMVLPVGRPKAVAG
ncbi:MAG: hypothetical protein JL50_04085 [Peptococcaceae bacterium BICA1-7]|nr:MAG: hypothetical protein JL50_04085 [Peptococcaceae bacterium BICA1-7]HBV97557.1 hypothetical protein [Desulfotomaculum sp.]